MVKLSVKGCAFASGVLWAAAVGLVGLANMTWAGYGDAFLRLVSSIYPGYHGVPTPASILVGTGYALLDGAIGGAIFAWLYNRCARA